MNVTPFCHVTSRDMSRSQSRNGSRDCHMTITTPHHTKEERHRPSIRNWRQDEPTSRTDPTAAFPAMDGGE